MTSESRPDPLPPATPSPLSPVGQGGGYSVEIDDDDDDQQELLPNVSPVAHNDGSTQGDTILEWRYVNEHPSNYHLEDDDMERPLLFTQPESTRLNCLNYLNVIAYLVNVFVSFGIGVWGLGGCVPTRWDISKEYVTLVTPASWAHYLWAPILIFEAIFAIAQLFPDFRARRIVQDGTGYYFFYTCLIQIAWTLLFSFKLIILSFVAVVLALLSLCYLLVSQHYSLTHGRRSPTEYWLFRFPFYLHCGWLIACSAVQFSMLFRYSTSNVGVQLAADIVALGAMLPAATFFLTGQPSGPDFVIPLVIILSYISIALPLHSPSPEMVEAYEHFGIIAVQDAAYFFAVTVGCMLVPRVVIWVTQEFCTIQVVELDDYSNGLV